MTAKHILYSDDARAGLAAGIHKMAEAVKVTLGPKGRYVALEKKFGRGTPVFTNDGVTVAKGILTENQVENMGLLLIREAAIRTNDIAGDGTTTATLLADVLVTEGLRLVEAGAEALPLRRGMEKAVDAAVKAIEEQAVQVEGRDQVARVAFISSGDETVGNTIAEAVEAVGSTGGISCADGSSFGVEVEIVEGIRYDRGFVVPAMITDEEHHFGELENPLVLVTDHEIKDVRPIIPMLERVVQSKRDLFIISNDLRGEALHTIMLNTTRGTFRTIATEMPDYVEEHNKNLLADIALACGATPYFKDTYPTLDDLTFDFLGGCDRVRVTKDTTVITGGHGDPVEIEKRANYLRSEIARIVNPVFIEKLEDRLQKLLGKVAIIRIGAASEAELKEMKSRMEDALCATMAAMEQGIVPGGGVAMLNAIDALDDLDVPANEQAGVDIVRKALAAPMLTIAQNSGYNGSLEVEKLLESGKKGYGRDYKTGEMGNMIEMGILDPVKVTKIALESAASVAGLVLITETTTNTILKPVDIIPGEDPEKRKGYIRM